MDISTSSVGLAGEVRYRCQELQNAKRNCEKLCRKSLLPPKALKKYVSCSEARVNRHVKLSTAVRLASLLPTLLQICSSLAPGSYYFLLSCGTWGFHARAIVKDMARAACRISALTLLIRDLRLSKPHPTNSAMSSSPNTHMRDSAGISPLSGLVKDFHCHGLK